MTPYYADRGITIYHSRCEDVLWSLGRFDLLLTDPPYGIAAIWQGGGWHSKGVTAEPKEQRNGWDQAPPDEVLLALVAQCQESVIWGGNYFRLPPARGWLVWNKPERNFTLGEAELAWTTRDAPIRVFDHPRSEPGRTHPTQKPLALMRWCLSLFPAARSVLDPYMGSGTTLRACQDFGLTAVGIEQDEACCEQAARRLGQLAFPLADPPPLRQEGLWSSG